MPRARSTLAQVALAAAAALAASTLAGDARADGLPLVLWPTLVPAGDDPSPAPLHRPAETEPSAKLRADELDATLRDAVQDLGFDLDVSDPGPEPGHLRDLDLLDRAGRRDAEGRGAEPAAAEGADGGTWVVSPRLEVASSGEVIVRIVVAAPGARQLRVRVERVAAADVSARGLVMLRDLLATLPARPDAPSPARENVPSHHLGVVRTLRSQGRAILAAHAAGFGAFGAFSIQRASGSDDPRVMYPLLALGTGVGVGAALLVAEEWDVGTGDAWFLASGAWWGVASGLLFANGQDVQPFRDRYAWGVGAGLAGLGVATLTSAWSKMDEGDAVLSISGGGAGLLFGTLGERIAEGDVTARGTTGAGLGAAAGVVATSVLATQITVSPSRVMLVDLGVGLGTLAGAAAASPLVFEDATPGRARGFLVAATAGAVAGGAAALWLTRRLDTPEPGPAPRGARALPWAGPVGVPRQGEPQPLGGGVSGVF